VRTLIAGRKLLLADDSIAIQKVIDLTFTDEGMEVTTVGDGQDALEVLKQFTPDVVLADVYMPGVDGYELCQFIKQSERFRGVPVMLLIGTFEPFDEARARRAGADDVVTKPFQSIRQLVSRVGSLLGNEQEAKNETADKYSMLGLGQAVGSKPEEESRRQEAVGSRQEAEEHSDVRVFVEAPPMSDSQVAGNMQEAEDNKEAADAWTEKEEEHSDVRVFVEAPVIAESEAANADEHTCPTDIDLQTADTKQLERIDGATGVAAANNEFDDTIEIEAVAISDEHAPPPKTEASQSVANQSEDMHYQTRADVADMSDDGVLDLGDVDSFVSAQAEDDFILDLDVEPVATAEAREPVAVEPIATPDSAIVVEPLPEEPVAQTVAEAPSADSEEWALIAPVNEAAPEEEKKLIEPAANQAGAANLSPEAIEAISRRVVEQLSDRVVREIAWEVVPELSELLIKKKLEEQK